MPTRPAGDGDLSEATTPETSTQGDPDPASPAAALIEPALIESVSLEFAYAPEDAARLLRVSALAARREGRMRTAPLHVVWHDTAAGALARQGLSLAEQRGVWRLECLMPGNAAEWLPATPAPVLAEASSPAALGQDIPGGLVPVAAFTGRRRMIALRGDPDATMVLLEGTLRGVAQDLPACRLVLTGQVTDMARLARSLGEQVALHVPRAGLASQAMALVAGRAAPARRLGAPALAQELSVDAALRGVVAHLAEVILYWAGEVPQAKTQEAVHQMRVAVRRLRSALAVFSRAAGDGLGATLGPRLKALASLLGAARDWDVFLSGTGAAVAEAFPDDRRIAGLIGSASRKQAGAYAALRAFLGGQEWRRLAMDLALLPVLRPWPDAASPQLAAPAQDYAAKMLGRRLKHVAEPGASIAGLNGEPLHDVRKQAKRLRYAAEFFAPFFAEKPARRYLKRLSAVQESLGTLNDAAVAASLMGALGGGADRAFAAGAVQGFTAARSAKAGAEAARAWKKFYRETPFWA